MQSSTRSVSTCLINKSFYIFFENTKITPMLLYNCSAPIVTTVSQDAIETITPGPNNNNNNNNKITSFVTTTTTVTMYYAGFSTTVTTTNSQGELITYSTYIPPSTVLVVKKVAV